MCAGTGGGARYAGTSNQGRAPAGGSPARGSSLAGWGHAWLVIHVVPPSGHGAGAGLPHTGNHGGAEADRSSVVVDGDVAGEPDAVTMLLM
eukprot:9095235-Heterocapsa_arctica.AAC.1